MSDHADPRPFDSERPLEYSPLEREVERDGTSVKVRIYRGQDGPGWLLEVEDHKGGSTVWDDMFDSDLAALDEALRAIEEDGIHSFAEASSDPHTKRAAWSILLEQSHLTELRRLLNGAPNLMSFDETCGLFAAVATAPHMVAPGQWLDLIKGKHIFEDSVEVQRFTNGVMALYNEVLRSVAELGAHCCPDPADRDAVRAFCRGYLRIALEDATWEAEPHAYTRLLPMMVLADLTSMDKLTELSPAIASDPDAWLRKKREDLGVTLVELYDHWADEREAIAERLAQQALPMRKPAKVGRNDPCPCGSGKKSKKCCAN